MIPTHHKVSWAKLGLCVSSWIAATMFAGFDANAFDCLPSADAVRQQDSTAWPSWTLRAPGFEGTKCWYPSTQAAAHDHRKPPVQESTVVINLPREPEPEVTGSANEFDRDRTSKSNLDSAFEDRFSAVCPIAGNSVPGCVARKRK
jgi:hypothetical protein